MKLNRKVLAAIAGVAVIGVIVWRVAMPSGGGAQGPRAAGPVPVLAGDTEDALSARILRQEHRLYPLVVRWFGEGRIVLADNRVAVRDVAPGDTLLFSADP